MGRRDKVTTRSVVAMKQRGEKIVMLTAYDYQTAVMRGLR